MQQQQHTSASQFGEIARTITDACRSHGMTPPSFRTPPKSTRSRTVRRFADGTALVAVRISGRSLDEVSSDMIDGALLINELSAEQAAAFRDEVAVIGAQSPAAAA